MDRDRRPINISLKDEKLRNGILQSGVRNMDCVNKVKNSKDCNCSYGGCSRMGICCECIRYHRASGELPACYFPADAEKTYDRSIEYFIEVYQKRRHL